MKRLVIIFLCAFYAALYVDATNQFVLSTLSGRAGDTLTIEAHLQCSEPVAALQMVLPLGPNLSYLNMSAQFGYPQVAHQIQSNYSNGILYVTIFNFTGTALTLGDKALFEFKLILGKEPQTIDLTPEVILSDSAGQSVSVNVSSGSITILSPKIEVLTSNVDFGHIPILATYNKTLQVKNVGTEELHISNAIISSSTLTLPQSSWTISPGATESIVLTYSPVVRGAISETIRFRSDAVNDADVFRANKVTVVADPFSVNELHATCGQNGSLGDTVTISLSVNNMEPLVGVQCSFKLHNALEYVANSATVSTRSVNHSVISTISNDTLTLMLYSIQNATLAGSDGEVMTFKIRLNGTSGDYDLTPIEVILSNITGENMTSASYGAYVQIKSPRLSASSSINFGHSPVTETVTSRYTIRNQGNATLSIDKITFLNNGFLVLDTFPISIEQGESQKITISYTPITEGDYETTMQVYSNDPINRMHTVFLFGHIYEPNNISLSGELTEDGYLLHVGLDNYTDIVGFQMNLECVADMHPELQKSARLDNHQTLFYAFSDSTYRILAYSLANSAIEAHSGELFSILFRNTNVPSYNHSYIVLDSIFLADRNNQQRLTSTNHTYIINEQRRIMTFAENGMVVITDSTPVSTGCPPIQPFALPKVPFEFDFAATDYNPATATIQNHPEANLVQYQLQLTSNLPTVNEDALSISHICKGYINKWGQEYTESGDYFARSGNDSLTIVFKVAPRLGLDLTSDLLCNRGWGGHNYMLRVGMESVWFLNTDYGVELEQPYDRTLRFSSEDPQVLVCRVNGGEDYILLENMSTGEKNRVKIVNWGHTGGTAFKFFYNDDGEYFLGDFYWMYYSFNYLSDQEVKQVIDYHNNVTINPTDTTSSDSCLYDYGSILYLSAIPNAGYKFQQWSDGDTSNPRIVSVTEDALYTAVFEIGSGANIENDYIYSPAVKYIYNGQILILRGEKVYTVTGQEVR